MTCQCGGLTAVIQSRIEKGASPDFSRIVSRETFRFREGREDDRIVPAKSKTVRAEHHVLP